MFFRAEERSGRQRESGPSTGSFSAFLIPSFHVSILACASVLHTYYVVLCTPYMPESALLFLCLPTESPICAGLELA